MTLSQETKRMSTSASSSPLAKPVPPDPVLRVVSHTGLLYWWPVWLIGFILSGLTYLDRGRLAIVPEGTTVKNVRDKVYELTVPDNPGPFLEEAAQATASGENAFPVRASGHHDYGLVFVLVLLLVIFGSNVPLRGLWSVVALLSLLLLAGVLLYFDVMGRLLERLVGLHIEITLAGYLLTSIVLLVMWLVVVFGFDQLHYVRFTAGQFMLREGIGDARAVFDMTRVTVRKRRSDVIRHWVLGLGAGDLVISVPNQSREIVLPDVLFVDSKIKAIAELMKIRPVTAG
jgi:hypothetical protein